MLSGSGVQGLEGVGVSFGFFTANPAMAMDVRCWLPKNLHLGVSAARAYPPELRISAFRAFYSGLIRHYKSLIN